MSKKQNAVEQPTEAIGNHGTDVIEQPVLETPVATESNQDHSLDWKAVGFDEGAKIEASIAETSKACIDMLVNFAEKLKGYAPSQLLFLEGYGEARGDTRKSEAKAVFEAYGRAKADNNKALAGSQAVSEAVLQAKADKLGKNAYADFIEACRLIRGKKAQGRSAGTQNAPTEKQLKEVVERVGKANATQAVQVLSEAVNRVTSLKMNPLAVIRQIRTLAESLNKTETYDLAIVDFGKQIATLAFGMIERHENAEKEARARKAEADASKAVIPTPAEAALAKAA